MAVDSPPPAPHRARAARLVPLLVIAAGFVLFFALGLHRHVTFDALRDSRAALTGWVDRHPLSAVALYILGYVVVVACSLPVGFIATISGGFLFGTWLGGFSAVCGATIGAIILFSAARTALGDVLRARAGSALARFETGFRENAFSYLLALRLIPAFPFFLVNLAPAFLGVRLSTFAAATFLGIMPATFVYASVGAGLGEVFDAGVDPDLSLFAHPSVYLPLIGLALLALLPPAWRHWRRRPA
jgi:uncharacterized membrane protein YdjX (TVP38/TMEM64 family)